MKYELRIGNLVQGKDRIIVIESISDKGFNHWVDDEGHFSCCRWDKFDTIKPVPLTEKWLLNFGFGGFIIDGEEIWKSLPIPDIDLHKTDAGFIFDGWGRFPVQYVHQLQNLYFAITHQELEIK